MEFHKRFQVWDKLSEEQQARLSGAVTQRTIKKGAVIHNGVMNCLGMILVDSGQFRSYINSEEGREITLYRLFEMDICLFSAACMMKNIQFDVTIEAEKDSSVWIVPPQALKELMEESAPVANYLSQIMAGRLSEIMWLIERLMWKSFDKRLAAFLLEESTLEDSPILYTTHEKIANHLGTAREVVTRMLRQFQKEGIVSLKRGSVQILHPEKLKKLER